MIVKGTTPRIRFTFSKVTPENITTAFLTIKQSNETIIEKDISEAEVGENYLEWELSQNDTLAIDAKQSVKIQCR